MAQLRFDLLSIPLEERDVAFHVTVQVFGFKNTSPFLQLTYGFCDSFQFHVCIAVHLGKHFFRAFEDFGNDVFTENEQAKEGSDLGLQRVSGDTLTFHRVMLGVMQQATAVVIVVLIPVPAPRRVGSHGVSACSTLQHAFQEELGVVLRFALANREVVALREHRFASLE